MECFLNLGALFSLAVLVYQNSVIINKKLVGLIVFEVLNAYSFTLLNHIFSAWVDLTIMKPKIEHIREVLLTLQWPPYKLVWMELRLLEKRRLDTRGCFSFLSFYMCPVKLLIHEKLF